MCGIVCTFGRPDGVGRVLNALSLLSYRAPDSTGLAVLDQDGAFAVRRCVGDSDALRQVLSADPLPPLRQGDVQVVLGHGRWAMVGAVSVTNAHPISDRSRDRMVCENGSHNAILMLEAFAEQEAWWHARELPESETAHRTENTTEVLAFEWERLALEIEADAALPDTEAFLARLDAWEVSDLQERALRAAVWRLHDGNAHACAFYHRAQPETLYVTSHQKPVAFITRLSEDGQTGELMVASDVHAGLMLWPPEEVGAAALRIRQLQRAAREQPEAAERLKAETETILARFAVDVLFLDADLNHGNHLFAKVTNAGNQGRALPAVLVSTYDGAPLAVASRRVTLNPAMIGKDGFASYTESHIAEIPDVVDRIVSAYERDGQLHLESTWHEDQLFSPGLNLEALQRRFGRDLGRLRRLLLVGEGSSWRDAQASAPLYRQLLPDTTITVFHPVELLNLGEAMDPAHDLVVEISWSGTTDSVLKVDSWLSSLGVMRLGVTGRPQSDLGRRTVEDGGTVDVLSGVEVSVATVKGYLALLLVLDMIALQLESMRRAATGSPAPEEAAGILQLHDAVKFIVPQHIRTVIESESRRQAIREVADRCANYNKVAVVGNSPVDLEAELKIEELAQIVACCFDFETASLRPLAERSALASDDEQRTLFILNLTNPEAMVAARPLLAYLRGLGLFCLVHTYAHESVETWRSWSNVALFASPQVTQALQPLVDAPFFFDLAVGLAYARGLTPAQIDRPRNLAKSVTVTGAERRDQVEGRMAFRNTDLETFAGSAQARQAWDASAQAPSTTAMRATAALRAALAVLTEPLPEKIALDGQKHLIVLADSEATENAAQMAAAAWKTLLGVDLIAYRRFLEELPATTAETAWLRLVGAGPFLHLREDGHTISLPSDMSPLARELLGAVYLCGLAIRLARQRGADTSLWEKGLAQLPLCLERTLGDGNLRAAVRGFLKPLITQGYDKVHIIGGGQDFTSAASMARSLRLKGFMAEPQYTDSAWHGPLAAVGGPDAAHDTIVVILATDPLFQSAALVDTQVYRTRHAHIMLVVPSGNETLPAVASVGAESVVSVCAVPRPFTALVGAALGRVFASEMEALWEPETATG
jgi:glucosamine 6-phosphate synthetase-like amidotransferase/phosphosugar isomerase protein